MQLSRLCLLACLVLGWMTVPGADALSLRLVPFPKEVNTAPGTCSVAGGLEFAVADTAPENFGSVLNQELRRAGLPEARVRRLEGARPRFQLSVAGRATDGPLLPETEAPERYALAVSEGGIVALAAEPSGLFHALQTLCQLIRANREGATLPCLVIRDWPSLRWRCFQDDMTRGPSSTLDTLKFEAGLGSYLKLNLMTFYMEYQFAFRKHPRIGPPDGSLTPEDLAALVNYAKARHVDILGNQQSFGHFAQILKHPEYESLRETADVLTPVREGTYKLLDDLYAEVCPLVPFPWFNVCCDETFGLGTGPARQLASEIGVGGVYVRHINRVHDLLRDRHHKRMMMWGDIILQHPDHLKDVPRDTLMLTWGYDARPSFEDQILPFARSGFEFFVCPGVNNWSRILPDFGVAVTNIQNFVRDGSRHGALGMINTDWEDDGEALNAMKWHADAWAAECAWNASSTPYEAFQRRVGAVLFGERGDHFGQAIGDLTRVHRLGGMKGMFNSRFWEPDIPPRAGVAVTSQNASNLLACVRPALAHLDACAAEAVDNQHVLDTLRFGARRLELIGERMIHGLELAALYEQASQGSAPGVSLERGEALLRSDRDAHEALGREFATLWLRESKPYALDWTLRRYTNAVAGYNAVLARWTAARAQAQAGRTLPPADEVGIAVPRPLERQVRPREVMTLPLQPEGPWVLNNASHRVGIEVQAGDRDRYDQPVMLEVGLPEDVTSLKARVMRSGDSPGPREVLAQLDPIPSARRHRLTFILPGTLAKGSTARVFAYVGDVMEPSPLPAAVSTSPGTNGTVWLENRIIRALLSPEGAHIYRWEVKSLGGRDLTMPGESDWAGFSDLGSHRQASYRLECTARGPVMLEFQCLEPAGHTKTIRLFGGMSWMEVILGEPTALYWDFDDPKNFSADGPTPGLSLFSDGTSQVVWRGADGLRGQEKVAGTTWSIKYNPVQLALGLITPGTATTHCVAPGAEAGGVGIEGGAPAAHFVTFAGVLPAPAEILMNRLQDTLDLKRPIQVRLHAWQKR